jgi:hypothetical protein
MMSATADLADNKSDRQKGVAMIKAKHKKKHPAPVLVTLRKALGDATISRPRVQRAASKRQAETSSVHCYRP